MFLIAHSFRNGQIAISKRPKKKFERVRGPSNGVDLVLLFACLTYTSKLYQRVLFYISFHLKLTHAISRVSFTWNDLMTKKKKANFNCATEQTRESHSILSAGYTCEGMNIGLIHLRFDILTVIIVCFVLIEASLIIYSAYFRGAEHSEAPVSVLSIDLFEYLPLLCTQGRTKTKATLTECQK